MKTKTWRPIWVEDMPETMEEGAVYISPKHRLTEHLCACGCRAEVSLSLGRSEWKIEYDGETVSLWPSVGNWQLPCKSHYIIQNNKTGWCSRWSEEEILAGRSRDRQEKQKDIEEKRAERTWWKRAWRIICGNRAFWR